jgi:hypothetical protein
MVVLAVAADGTDDAFTITAAVDAIEVQPVELVTVKV